MVIPPAAAETLATAWLEVVAAELDAVLDVGADDCTLAELDAAELMEADDVPCVVGALAVAAGAELEALATGLVAAEPPQALKASPAAPAQARSRRLLLVWERDIG